MGILMVLLVHAECRLGYLTFYGGMFYMPIFFVAAGYTYRCRSQESYGCFLRKKAVRLLGPYLGVSLFLWAFFVAKDCVLGSVSLGAYERPLLGVLYARSYLSRPDGQQEPLMTVLNSPLWFLPALFLAYAWYDAIRRRGRGRVLLLLGLGGAILWHLCTRRLLPWSLDAVPYFACYLAGGEWLREKDGIFWLRRRPWAAALLGAFFLLAGWYNSSGPEGNVNLSCGQYGRSMLLYLLVGTAGSVLIFLICAWLERLWRRGAQLLAWVGERTLPVLCFHMLVFLFVRTGAQLLGLGAVMTRALLVGLGLAIPTAGAWLWSRVFVIERGRSRR